MQSTYLVSNMADSPQLVYRRVALVLGAGASYDLGYPLMWEVLDRRYLDWLCEQYAAVTGGREGADRILTHLSSEASHLRQHSPNIEALLDASNTPRELRNRAIDYIYSVIAVASEVGMCRISRTTEEYLLFAALILDQCLAGECTVITFNYDTVVEEAISFMSSFAISRLHLAGPYHFHYGLSDLRSLFGDNSLNIYGTTLDCAVPIGRVPILKLHGSSNLVICDSCGSVYYAPHELLSNFASESIAGHGILSLQNCRECDAVTLSPLIVPPGLRKQLPARLDALWGMAEQAIESAEIVLIAGYSLPDYDMEARELLFSSISRKDVLLVDPSPSPSVLAFLESARPARLIVVRKTLAEFLRNESTQYFPDYRATVAPVCEPHYLFPECLTGRHRI